MNLLESNFYKIFLTIISIGIKLINTITGNEKSSIINSSFILKSLIFLLFLWLSSWSFSIFFCIFGTLSFLVFVSFCHTAQHVLTRLYPEMWYNIGQFSHSKCWIQMIPTRVLCFGAPAPDQVVQSHIVYTCINKISKFTRFK